MENDIPSHHSAENLVTSAVNRVKQTTEEQIHRAGVYTRRSPFMALAIAAACGYVLRVLPVRALLGLFLRLGLVTVRPFIFIFGAANLYDFLKGRGNSNPSSVEEYSPGEGAKITNMD